MSSLKIEIVIFAVLCLALQINSKAQQEHRNLYFPKAQIAFERQSLNAAEIAYAICDDSSDQPERKCQVAFDMHKHDGADASCNVTLKAETKNGIIGRQIRALKSRSSRSSKAILIWLDKSKKEWYLKFTIVRRATCYKTEAKVIVDGRDPNVDTIVNDVVVMRHMDDTFDIVYRNSTVCGNKVCKLTFNEEGEQVSGPVSWFTPKSNGRLIVETIAEQSPSEGHLVIEELADGPQVSIIRTNEELKVLKHYSTNGPWNYNYALEYGIIGICFSANTSTTCEHYDVDGNLIKVTTLEFPSKSIFTFIRNLKDGEFLLLNSECTNSTCFGSDNRYYLTRVDAAGKRVGSMEIKGFVCDLDKNAVMAHVFENDDGRWVLIRACYATEDTRRSKEDRGHLDVLAEYFALDELK